MTAKYKKKTLDVLRAIRDGNKHTMANPVMATLGQAALIEILEVHPKGTVKKVCLSEWGKTWLAFAEKEIAAGRARET
jgi:hypothetical protein